MPKTQKEIEEEIRNLADSLDDTVEKLRELSNRAKPYLNELGKTVTSLLQTAKPVYKKQKLELELFWLQRRLEQLNLLIEEKRRGENTSSEKNDDDADDGS